MGEEEYETEAADLKAEESTVGAIEKATEDKAKET